MKRYNFVENQAVNAMYDAEARSGVHPIDGLPNKYNSMIREMEFSNVIGHKTTEIVENKQGEKNQITVNPKYPLSFGDMKKAGLI